MINQPIDTYFKNKNIDVSFNTLGSTDLLIDLFIQETQDIVNFCNGKISNKIKNQCYNKYYKIEARDKFTGFEKFHKLDQQMRFKMTNHLSGLIGKIEYEQPNKEHIVGSYLEELKDSFKKFTNPLLYLSGGIDSEFVALAMLDAGIEFTPVIFQWVNDSQEILNIHDILYALDFCNEHILTPIVRQVNLEKLWNNTEFELLAKETQNSSPQINTYVYMIELMAEEFKDSTHVLGGEIRFRIIENKNNISNFVTAAKVSPTTYDGVTYTLQNTVNYTNMYPSFGQSIVFNLRYDWDGNYGNNQGWTLAFGAPYGTLSLTGGPTSGTWFNADLPGGTGFDIRTSDDNGATFGPWLTLGIPGNSVSFNAVAKSLPGNMDADDTRSWQMIVQVRSKDNPGVVVSSSFTLILKYVYTATMQIYTTASVTTFTPPAGITSYSTLVVGGGGGGGGAIRTSTPGGGGEFNGAAGGGGAAGLYVNLNNIPYTSGAINFTVGSGGAGVDGSNGGAGTASSITLHTGTPYSASGGGGGLVNPNGSSRLGGDGGSNGLFSGGTGASTNIVEASLGGGGAGVLSNGLNAYVVDANTSGGYFSGLGGTAAIIDVIKGSNTFPVYVGGGGRGGQSDLVSPGIKDTGDPGIVPGWGGEGGAVLYPSGDVPFSGPGARGGDGRVYIYY